MRSVLLAIALAACGASSSHAPADAVPIDGPRQFTFTASYMLDSTITSASLGSTTYASGETIKVDLVFASYAASQGSGLTVQVVAGSNAGSFVIAANCPAGCTDAFGEQDDEIVSWANEVIVTDEGGSCDSPGHACGWAE
jgi:hypothetical protein